MNRIILITGSPASGKTTLTKKYTDQGYVRVNIDLAKHSIEELNNIVDQHLASGKRDIVIDNSYPTIQNRKQLIEIAKKHKLPIQCIWLQTSFEDSQLNACLRMVQLTGDILNSSELENTNHPDIFPSSVLSKYRKEFQIPTVAEGFEQVIKEPFIRVWPLNYTNKALFLDFDDTLRISMGKYRFPTNPKEIKIIPGRSEKLKEYQRNGYALFGISNQYGVAKGQISMEQANECFKETIHQLGVTMFYKFCPHNISPVTCYCHKPSTAIGAYFIENYKLRPEKCIMVGDQIIDKTFAKRCGFSYSDASSFFS